ncbi:unnamed protein product [Cuscuta campestris]|uniref:cytokinin riboside 5'-monophosphate phosphoribohydrolase n=1 Tax=Cuscuta campestris TaxID=132261 RepID=A0A484L614_9ASTE|nr:unnamed protein product [Cuscuta campestris]
MEDDLHCQSIQTPAEARKRRKLIIQRKRQSTAEMERTDHTSTSHERKQGHRRKEPDRVKNSNLQNIGGELTYKALSNPTEICQHCQAIMWKEERNNSRYQNRPPTFSLCCMEGRIKLEALKPAPEYLGNLLSYSGGKRAKLFRENIRAYNSIFAFTSIGADINYEINKSKGPYVFRISGQNYHQIGSLMPQSKKPHKFLQLYMYDDHSSEVHSRINSLTKDKPQSKLDPDIVAGIMHMTTTLAQRKHGTDRLQPNHTQRETNCSMTLYCKTPNSNTISGYTNMLYDNFCIFARHALGSNPRFMATSVDLERELVRRKIRLTYGGGNVGLQGAVASIVYNNGGRVRGFILGYIATRQVYGPTYSVEYNVSSNYYKYFEMNHIVEAFIVLPGGIDTMEGLFTLISWASERLHSKPIDLLNIDGYFNNLIKFLDDAVRQNFMALN